MGVVVSRGNLAARLRQHPADRYDPESSLLPGDESADHGYRGSVAREHFDARELASALPSLRRSLRSEGGLVVEVPFAPPARVAATSKYTPHLIFFTPAGLETLLKRHRFTVRLCVVGPGTPKNSVNWVRRSYPVSDQAIVGKKLADRLPALNHKDFVSCDPAVLESKAASGVIKCVAVPTR